MFVIADLIFMLIDSWFSEYRSEEDESILNFEDVYAVEDFVKQVNFNFHDLRKFDNFKGGYCITDDTRQYMNVILYLLDENEEILPCSRVYLINR